MTFATAFMVAATLFVVVAPLAMVAVLVLNAPSRLRQRAQVAAPRTLAPRRAEVRLAPAELAA